MIPEKYQVILEVEHTGESEIEMEAFVEELRCLKTRSTIAITSGDFRLAKSAQDEITTELLKVCKEFVCEAEKNASWDKMGSAYQMARKAIAKAEAK